MTVRCVSTAYPRPPDLSHQLRVHNDKLETELVSHFIPPLERKARWADYDRGPRAMTQEELLQYQAGLDRFTETHVVREQEIRPRCRQRTTERLDLVCLDRGS